MPGLIGPFPGDPLVAYSADGASRVAIQPGIPIFNPAYNAWMVFVKTTGASITGGNVVVCTGSNRYNATVELSSASTVPQALVAGVRPTGAAALASANYGYIIVHGPALAVSSVATAISAAGQQVYCGTAVGCCDLAVTASAADIKNVVSIFAISATAATTANVCDINIFRSCFV